MTPVLYLVRHGESDWNVKRLVQGQSVHPQLTALGRRQSRDAAELLRGVGATRLLTSDLVRATQTADSITAATGLRPWVTPLLREMDLGAWQGLPTSQAASLWEQHFARQTPDGRRGGGPPEEQDPGHLDDPDSAGTDAPPLFDPELRVPGGESIADVRARIGALLASPVVSEADGGVILVSHGDTIRIALGYLLGEPPATGPWREIANGSVQAVDRDAEGQVRFRALGR